MISNESSESNLNDISTDLIVDGRPSTIFIDKHIKGTYNLSFPGILLKRIIRSPSILPDVIMGGTEDDLKIINLIQQILRKQIVGTILILFDVNTSDEYKNSLLREYNGIINFYSYDDYIKENQTTIKFNIFQPETSVTLSPIPSPDDSYIFKFSEIKAGLYLSGEAPVSNFELLKRYNINIIINVTTHVKNLFPEDFEYHNIPIKDVGDVNIKQFFLQTYEIIEKAKKEGKNVLVHCQAGISRSATIVIAYLIKKENMSLVDALSYVSSKRNCVCPNFGFYVQLLSYEKELKEL